MNRRYKDVVRPSQDIVMLLDTFEKCGLHDDVTMTFNERFCVTLYSPTAQAEVDLFARCSIDTSVVPFVDYMLGQKEPSNLQEVECMNIKEAALRIWFERDLDTNDRGAFWPEKG